MIDILIRCFVYLFLLVLKIFTNTIINEWHNSFFWLNYLAFGFFAFGLNCYFINKIRPFFWYSILTIILCDLLNFSYIIYNIVIDNRIVLNQIPTISLDVPILLIKDIPDIFDSFVIDKKIEWQLILAKIGFALLCLSLIAFAFKNKLK
jgi:hypothetical protein